MYLVFNVKGMELKRTDKETVVDESKGFLKCKFYFSEEWDCLEKYVQFKTAFDESVPVKIGRNSSCEIPTKVMEGSNFFTMAVVGFTGNGNRFTTTRVQINMEMSGFEEFLDPEPPEPVGKLYSVFIKVFNEEGVEVTDANVRINGKWPMYYDSSIGYYVKKELPNELYIVSVSHDDYEFYTDTFTIENSDVYNNITLTKLHPVPEKIYLKVKNSLGENITDAKVFFDGQNIPYNSSEEAYTCDNDSLGLHHIKILKEEYEEVAEIFDIQRGVSEYNFNIVPKLTHNVNVVNTNGFTDCNVRLVDENSGQIYNLKYIDGAYKIRGLFDGMYSLIADKEPYTSYENNHIEVKKDLDLSFSLSNFTVSLHEENNVEGINISLDGIVAEKDNDYTFYNIARGEHTVTAEKNGYQQYSKVINVNENNALFTFKMVSKEYSVSLNVKDDFNESLTDAVVKIDAHEARVIDGLYTVTGLDVGLHNINIVCEGHSPYSESLEIIDANIDNYEVVLHRLNPVHLKIVNKDSIRNYAVFLNGTQVTTNSLYVSKGTHELRIQCPPYTDIVDTLNLEQDLEYNFSFNGLDVKIQDRDERNNVNVTLDGQKPYKISSDGIYYFKNIIGGQHELKAVLAGFEDEKEILDINVQSTSFQFNLTPVIMEKYQVCLKLLDSEEHTVINDAVVKIGEYALTRQGEYYVNNIIPAGQYSLEITHEEYNYSETIDIIENINKEYQLQKNIIVSFTVKKPDGSYSKDCLIRLNGETVPYVEEKSAYVIDGVNKGENSIFISAYGYKIINGTVEIGKSMQIPFSIEPAENNISLTVISHEAGFTERSLLYLNEESGKFVYHSSDKTWVASDLPVGVYQFKYVYAPRSPYEKELILEEDTTIEVTIPRVYDVVIKELNGIDDVDVKVDDCEPDKIENGYYYFNKLPNKRCTIYAEKEGYSKITQSFLPYDLENNTLSIEMVRLIRNVSFKCKYDNQYITSKIDVTLTNDNFTYKPVFDGYDSFILESIPEGEYHLNVKHAFFSYIDETINITSDSQIFEVLFKGVDVLVSEFNRLLDCELLIDDSIPPIMSDTAGNYYFENISLGRHSITCDRVGYLTKKTNFIVSVDDREFTFDLKKDSEFNVYNIQIELLKSGVFYNDAFITSDEFTVSYDRGYYKAKEVSENQHLITIHFDDKQVQRVISVDEDSTSFKFDVDELIVTFKGLNGAQVLLNGKPPLKINLNSTDIYAEAYYTFSNAKIGSNTLTVSKPQYKKLETDYDISFDGENFSFDLEPVFNYNDTVSVVSLDDFKEALVCIDDVELDCDNDLAVYRAVIDNGNHTLTVTQEGYLPFTKQINVSPYNRIFHFGLIPEDGDTNLYSVIINVNEPPDYVYLDGIHATYDSDARNYFLKNISTGKHFIEVLKEDYEYYSEIVDVTSLNCSFDVNIVPQKKYKLIIDNSDGDRNVSVKVDNTIVPYNDTEKAYVTYLIADQYEITASKEGYTPFNTQIVVTEETIVTFKLYEEPLPGKKVPIRITPLLQPSDKYAVNKDPKRESEFVHKLYEPSDDFLSVYVDGVKAEYQPDNRVEIGDSLLGSYYAMVTENQHHTVICNINYDKVPSKIGTIFPTREIIYVGNHSSTYFVYVLSSSYESEFKTDAPIMERMKFKSTQGFTDCRVFVDGVPLFYEPNYECYVLYNAMLDNYSADLIVEKEGYNTLTKSFRFNGKSVDFTLESKGRDTDLYYIIGLYKPNIITYSAEDYLRDKSIMKQAKVYVDGEQIKPDVGPTKYTVGEGKKGEHRLAIILDGYEPVYKYISGSTWITLVPNKGKRESTELIAHAGSIDKTMDIKLYSADYTGKFNFKEYDKIEVYGGTTIFIALASLFGCTDYKLSNVMRGFYYMIAKGHYSPQYKMIVVNDKKIEVNLNLSTIRNYKHSILWYFDVKDKDTGVSLKDCSITLLDKKQDEYLPVEYDIVKGCYKVYNVRLSYWHYNIHNNYHKIRIFKEGYNVLDETIKISSNSTTVFKLTKSKKNHNK